jgi:hypothetical protein
MNRTPAEIGELVAKVFDRLPQQFPEGTIVDALLLVEITDPTDLVDTDDGTDRQVPTTAIMAECTSDRVVVQTGIVEFARQTIVGEV